MSITEAREFLYFSRRKTTVRIGSGWRQYYILDGEKYSRAKIIKMAENSRW
jgi:hypothetical protein